jgi:multidrug efflux pump subunit AcrA (membrane-fusion protein)
MKKKNGKIKKIAIAMVILLVLGTTTLVLSLTRGGSANDVASAETGQTYTVSKGNLSLEISAAGNLALSETEDLAFELAGYVLSVDVEAGDSVTKGQELAKLDTTDYDQQIRSLTQAVTTAQHSLADKQNKVITAQRQVTALERAVNDAETAVGKAEQTVSSKELAVKQAELAVQTAENDLDNIQDVKQAQDAIDADQDQIDLINLIIKGVMVGGFKIQADISYLTLQKTKVKATLAEDQQNLAEILDGTSLHITDDVALQIAQANLQVELKKSALVDAQTALNDAETAVENAKIAVDDAKYAIQQGELAVQTAQYTVDDAEFALQTAQDNLEEAKSLSPIITAPFDGFITKVNVAGGDEIYKGAVAMQIADPNKFKAEIAVSEMDISQVTLDGTALVEVDALGVTLPATVTYIAPTATVQSGVVNYSVTVEVQSLTAAAPSADATTDNATMRPPAGATTENATMPSPAGMQNIFGQAASPTQTAANSLENMQPKAGMSTTVSLIVSERQNVLLVPYSAITTEGSQKYVQILTAENNIEKRAITTGITDYSFTEVTGGLSEGEKVLVSKTTTTKATTTTQTQQQSGGMMMPGMGGGPPPGGQ